MHEWMNLRIFLRAYAHVRTYTGLIVLLGSGVHTVWAFWQMYAVTPTAYTWIVFQDFFIIGSWYIATIFGTMVAAALVSRWTKKRLYVRQTPFSRAHICAYSIHHIFDSEIVRNVQKLPIFQWKRFTIFTISYVFFHCSIHLDANAGDFMTNFVGKTAFFQSSTHLLPNNTAPKPSPRGQHVVRRCFRSKCALRKYHFSKKSPTAYYGYTFAFKCTEQRKKCKKYCLAMITTNGFHFSHPPTDRVCPFSLRQQFFLHRSILAVISL